jgi:hypothetical protein
MPFQIENADDELIFRNYTTHRDAVRTAMGYGVFPNLVRALEAYSAFDTALANDLSDPDLLEYHASIMQAVGPHIGQLRQLAAGIVQIMQQIETHQPGTFGIQLPTPPAEPEA